LEIKIIEMMNDFFGTTIDVGVGTWNETNTFYCNSRGAHYCENIKNIILHPMRIIIFF